jgi:hypothetical protein
LLLWQHFEQIILNILTEFALVYSLGFIAYKLAVFTKVANDCIGLPLQLCRLLCFADNIKDAVNERSGKQFLAEGLDITP